MPASAATSSTDLSKLLNRLNLESIRPNNASHHVTVTSEQFDVWGISEATFTVPVLGCTCFREDDGDRELA
jgi:hypothetical protein